MEISSYCVEDMLIVFHLKMITSPMFACCIFILGFVSDMFGVFLDIICIKFVIFSYNEPFGKLARFLLSNPFNACSGESLRLAIM